MAALTRDTSLSGRYRLTGRIATGGMGEVWRAEDTLLHRPVAVKVLKCELTGDPVLVERFRAEARNTAALSHPGIAAVHDYGEITDRDRRTAYLVMELVEGEPLSATLARVARLPVSRVLDIVGQAAAALEAAHRTGMVHRDVKPGNLLVTPDNTVKITDFGIARVADTAPLTQAGMVVGTAQYFSPEQAEGRQTTPASDVYSLGVVAYECLAGRLPFMADSSVAVAVMQIRDQAPPLPEDVPPPVRALVGQAMAKDPRQRFRTGGHFAAAIHAVVAGHPPDERGSSGTVPPLATWIPPHPAPAAQAGQHGPMPPAPQAPPVPSVPRSPGSQMSPGGSLAASPTGGVRPAGSTAPQYPLPAPSGVSLGQHGTGTVAGPVPPGPPVRSGTPGPRRTALLILLVGLAVLAVVLAVALVTTRPSSQPGRINDSSPTATGPNPAGDVGGGAPDSPETVTVTVTDYLGRPAEDVSRELTGLGLDPVIRYADRGGQPGSVIAVEPRGSVPVGARVEIVAVKRRPDGRPQDRND